MPFSRLLFLLVALLVLPGLPATAARVDTLTIPSAAMNRAYRAAVVLPRAYDKQKKAAFPVLYLLHGAYGHFSNWLAKTPDKQLVHRLADQYNLIVVMPEGETFSFYLDSPLNPASQFESYLTRDVIGAVDQAYRTVRDRKGRVITGLSMGGHGALYLATRHPELYCAAGSMSGALDLSVTSRKLSPQEAQNRRNLFEPILGPERNTPNLYAANSVVNMIEQMAANNLPLIFDCGADDFLIDINREVHRRLLYQRVPHDYTERPGGHTWAYWQNALPYHVLFFADVLRANAVLVP